MQKEEQKSQSAIEFYSSLKMHLLLSILIQLLPGKVILYMNILSWVILLQEKDLC